MIKLYMQVPQASLVSTRNMRTRIMLAHSIWNGKNEMVKEVLKKMRNDKSNPWNRRLNLYLKKLEISFEQMVGMKKRTNSKENTKVR